MVPAAKHRLEGALDGAVVLVEGPSDLRAVEALARRRGRDLAAEGVEVVALGAAQALARTLALLGSEVRVAALYDSGETRVIERALERSGRGAGSFFA